MDAYDVNFRHSTYYTYMHYYVFSMSQWQNLRELDTVYQQRVSDLYNRDEFPMDVRHYLAHWIEGQDW